MTAVRPRLVAVAALVWLLLPNLGLAADPAWSPRPITMVVSYPPGAITDTVGRQVAERLGLVLGTSVIVENRPGARHSVRSTRQGETAMRRRTLLAASGIALLSKEEEA